MPDLVASLFMLLNYFEYVSNDSAILRFNFHNMINMIESFIIFYIYFSYLFKALALREDNQQARMPHQLMLLKIMAQMSNLDWSTQPSAASELCA